MKRVPAPLQHLAGTLLALTPLLVCISAGAIRASLWLDEILYWNFERSLALRALEMRRPGSGFAPFFMNYFYCDIQRVVHAILSGIGIGFQSNPELFLRFLSIVAFAAIGSLVYLRTFRDSHTWWWSVSAALAVSASPLLLFYAFEARMSALAAFGVIAFLSLLASAVRGPANWRLLAAGALLGIVLGRLHAWVVCLYLALCVVAFVRLLVVRQWREFGAVMAFAVPGGITTALEAAYITMSYPPGGEGFPLYAPRPLAYLQERTLAGMFAAGPSMPDLLRPFKYGPSLPLVLLFVALVFVVIQLRRSPFLLFPVAAALSLWLSTMVGARFGQMIVPRYQVPLFAALFFSLSFAMSRNARLVVALLAVLQIALLPRAISDIHAKGNGRQIASVIDAETPRERTAVVVQHGLRLGYPDPLHSFALQLYLNEVTPNGRMPILELPSLKDTAPIQGVHGYFGGGERLLKESASMPTAQWEQWLRTASVDRIWLVTPLPVVLSEAQQSQAFRDALEKSGFTLDRQRLYDFNGYPGTRIGLFVRNAGSIAPRVRS